MTPAMPDELEVPVAALSIAGSDPSGAAGLQGDLKTFASHGVEGMAVVALLTAQNRSGVAWVEALPADVVARQLDTLLAEHTPGATKTGALGSAAIVDVVVARAPQLGPLIVDPVLVSTSGATLLSDGAVEGLRRHLLPHATLVTPNAPEAALLTGRAVDDLAGARDAARALADLGARAVLVKGGHHGGGRAVDVLFAHGELVELVQDRVPGGSPRGTGCALSSAIAARVARGHELSLAVRGAKAWLTRAIRSAHDEQGALGGVDHNVDPRLVT